MTVTIALAGNPNSGKTTLFNALTGANQHVGNWPGVTVEKKEGHVKKHKDTLVVDLPGIYSLSPYTLEEVIARNYLTTEKPDVILNIVDGSNLERNLYLTTQLLEIGIPVVVAVNMMDIVKRNGDKIDLEKLAKELACPVVPISALKGTGVDALTKTAITLVSKKPPIPQHKFDDDVEMALAEIEKLLPAEIVPEQRRFYAIKFFERDEKVLAQFKPVAAVEGIIKNLEEKMDDDAESIITNERYTYISSIIKSFYSRRSSGLTLSDKIDRVVTNRWAALPIFVIIMAIVYYVSVTTVGTWVTDWTNDVLFGEIVPGAVSSVLDAASAPAWLSGLILDGIVAGVGAVLGFVPQILVLFIFLGFLEGCGYMARVAFIMDRIFRRFGLSGKSFIPMLVATGCGIPGVMASRTIESERDRRMTVMTTTFMPCGAKLPIIAMISGALFDNAWWVAVSAYFIGIGAVIVSGIILKKTKRFAGDPAPFVMELPAYHLPPVGHVLRSMWERGWSFIKRAGTIILLATIVIWFLQSFGVEGGIFTMVDDLNNSLLAVIGTALAWVFIPLGFGTWQATVATFTGLVAKETVVATLGVLYGFATVAEDGMEFWGLFAADFTGLAAYSFLIFNLLCAPCFAAIGAIRREMNNPRWTWFAIGYQTVFAYVIALCVYQWGSLFTTGVFTIGTAVGIILTALIIYLLFRTSYEKRMLKSNAKAQSVA